MVQIRTPESRYFEEAHLVLRRDGAMDGDQGDLIREAERILSDAERGIKTGAKGRKRWMPWLFGSLFGGVLGGGIVGGIWLLITFL